MIARKARHPTDIIEMYFSHSPLAIAYLAPFWFYFYCFAAIVVGLLVIPFFGISS